MKRGKREVKRAYGLGRRFLAMFLAMVMCTSMLQLTAFAAQFEDQTMDGYYTVASDGTVGTTDATYVEQDGFILKKEITQTGKDAFNITLTVETSQTVTTNEAAIQLVIDTSTSMDYCSNCSSSSSSNRNCSAHNVSDRMTEVKKVLTMDGGFLDSLVEANTGAINVSVVTYGLGAKTVTLDEADADQWVDIKDPAALAKVKSAINGLDTTDNATNMQAGLMLARNRLGMDAVQNAAVKYTVLLTDGYANTYTRNDDKNSTTSIANGRSPSSANGTTDGKSNATNMAAQVKATDTLLYAVGYGTDKPYLTDIIGDATKVFVGSDSASVAGAFKDIAEAAVSGMTGAGTSVTDPMGTDGGKFTMGQFIVLGDVSGLSDKGVTSSGGTLTWELDPEKAEKKTVGDTTTYTYSITYPITLNTAAEGFKEVDKDGNTKYYPTNGYTYLSVPQADGSTKPIAFLVPGVCGEIPEVNWTVEYYLQDANSIGGTATYTKDEDETKSFGPVDVWTIVNAPDGYATKYASNTGDDYTFVAGQTTMQVTPTGENVMRLYYNLVTDNVVVNHYYKTDKINVDGTLVPGSYSDPNVEGPITWKVNNNYTATPDTKGGTYTLDEAMSDALTIKVTKGGNNVINLYYTRTQDDSVKTSAQVNHVYRTYAYVLGEDGKYGAEPVLQGEPVTEIAQAAPLVYATTKYDVGTAPIEGYEDYILNTSEGHYSELAANGMSFIIAEDAEDNIRTLYFDKVIDRRVPVTVTVNHYYTKSVTSVVDGEVVTTVDPNGVKGNTSTIDAYAGEAFTASQINDYNGDEYISDPGNAGKLVIRTLPAADSVIDLYYTINRAPEEGSITVNHYWRTFTEVTVEDIDEETGEVIGTDIVIKETVNHSEEGIVVEDLYVGQKYTAPQKSWGEGYFFNADDSKITGTVGTDRVLNLYYDKWAEDDERNDATINVQHIYTTYLTTIVNGAVQTLTLTADLVEEPFEGLAGDEFTAVPKFMYNGDEYGKITADAALSVILQPGTNDTIVINYEREARNLVETNYVVNHVYKTYSKIIVDGVAVEAEPEVETIYGEEISGYVGEDVTLNNGAKEGFTALTTNPGTAQTLAASGNEWTFVHVKYVDLDQGSVIVNHHYSQQTINLDGSVKWTSNTVTMDPVVKYLGETYTAEPIKNGYDKMDAILDTAAFAANEADKYVLTVSGNHVVDFHYKKVVDYREFATYTVTHDYYLYDYDGTLLSHPDPMTDTYSGYLAHSVFAYPQDTDYTLTEVTFNGEVLTEAPYAGVLSESENAFVFTYVKILPRDTVDVTVIHNYYKDEASMSGETAEVENQYVETITEIPEDTAYTAAEHVLEDAAYTYTFHSSDPEPDAETGAVSITVSDEGENVIIMNYVRATAEYKVIHIYNRNGVEEGRTSAVLGGLDGDVILADSIERVPVYEGRTYTFKSITGDITLDAGEMQTITLVYNRTTGGGGGGGGTIIIPEPPVPLDPQPEPEVEIPEEDVPLVEIPEEEVPLVDVPKTGDASALWMLMSVLSGTGLAGVTFLGRKKKEEE